MLHLAFRLFFLILVAASASASEACRVFLAPAERLGLGYNRGAISAVALVRITRASYVSPPQGDAHPWRASAEVHQVLSGKYASKRVNFGRGHGSAACDDGHPIARVGETWVIYFWQREGGAYEVWQSYPAAIAFAADSRLTGLSAHKRP
jgi:hypothetical protein